MALKVPTKQIYAKSKTPTKENDLEKYKIIIEGSDKDDRIYGNTSDNHITTVQGNDTIVASLGNDYIDGGTGFDTVDYGSLSDYVVVDLEKQSATKGTKATLGKDEFYSIENVIGTRYNDIISGDGYANVLQGGSGHDELFGRSGNDELIGDWGNDILVGGRGKDILNGGSGSDTASYEDAAGGVMVDLGSGIGAYGDAYGDTFISIENLTGSIYSDWLWGDDKANVIKGLDDKDFLFGRAGDDVLDGGAEDDILDGGAGADELIGGSGTDTAEYKDSASAVTVRLSDTSSGGDAEGDTYSSVENANGSAYSDHFFGTASANRFFGRDGADTFHGDAGADFYDGGEGMDTVDYSASEGRVVVDLIDGEGHFGDANLDTYESIENIIGGKASINSLKGDDGSNHIISQGLKQDYVNARGGIDTIKMRGRLATINAGSEDDVIEIWDVQDLASWQAYNPINPAFEVSDIDGGEGFDTINFGSEVNWVNLGNGNLLAGDLGVDVRLYIGGLPNEGHYKFDGMHFSGNVNSDGIATGIAHVTWGEIKNIENVTGTQYNDSIIGNPQSNILKGEGSDDYLSGDAGNDILKGGTGKDTLEGGADNDTLIGGAGADDMNGGDDVDTAVYEDSDAGIFVSLQEGSGPGVGGHAEGDTLQEIENIIGSNYQDFLVGSAGDNILEGGGDDDVLDGAGGNDLLIGGEGADEFLFGAQFGFSDSHTTIGDFEIGVDKINLSHFAGIDSWEDVQAHLTDDIGVYYGEQPTEPYPEPVENNHVYFIYDDAVVQISSGWAPVGTSFDLAANDFIF